MVSNLIRVELDFHCFRVASIVAAHLSIRWIFCMSSRIAWNHRLHTFKLGKDRFGTPETSSTKYRNLVFHFHDVISTSFLTTSLS